MRPPRTSAALRGALLAVALAELLFTTFCWTHPPVGVLVFHDLAEPRSPLDFWTVPPASFRAILDRLEALGFLTVDDEGLLALRQRWGGHPPACLLSFDDGLASHRDVAAPELLRRRMKGLFFLVSGRLGAPRMSAADAGRLAAAGFVPGSHSATHASLLRGTGESVESYRSRLAGEVGGSRAELERIAGRPVLSFAYPGGEVGDEARRAVVEAGYRLAFTTELGYVQSWSDPMVLPRNLLFRDATGDSVEEYLTAPIRWLRWRLGLDALVIGLLVGSFAIRPRGRPASARALVENVE